ncbi:MAG: hypothetical protein E6G92_05390 [Alphaproteobacteria bacterium]|nr:MAG: hypothetical protein E6G92_05390 [Alphaproteobacteria bacterium]
MRSIVLLLLLTPLAGCDGRPDSGSGPRHGGRYQGIGTYPAGTLWSRQQADRSRDPASATIADDEQVIVVVDSSTGEVRQCGNLSGYCIRTNPWSGAAAPARLTAHAADVAREAEQTRSPEMTDAANDLNAAADAGAARGR